VMLERVATSSKNAHVWSDLAAARYAAALEAEDARQFAQALAAADAALRIEPRSAEALFNRALILEQLGLREQARSAWLRFLETDTQSAWRREAEAHLAALKPDASFKYELERQYASVSRDRAAATALADRFPQDARVWGESEILSRWARSSISGDDRAAAAHLQIARFFGDALAQRRSERLLRDAVRTIISADPVTTRTLAEAHIEFREAQKAYKAHHLPRRNYGSSQRPRNSKLPIVRWKMWRGTSPRIQRVIRSVSPKRGRSSNHCSCMRRRATGHTPPKYDGSSA
jgi:tetratricopeptide (TPR) repeat protein